jgi:hypothetical protein
MAATSRDGGAAVVEAMTATAPSITDAPAAPATTDRGTILTSILDEPARPTARPTRRLRGHRSAGHQARNLAAAWLQRAERRLRATELETDRL